MTVDSPPDTVHDLAGLLLNAMRLLLANGSGTVVAEAATRCLARACAQPLEVRMTYLVDHFRLDVQTGSGYRAAQTLPIDDMRVAPTVTAPILALADRAAGAGCAEAEIRYALTQAEQEETAAGPPRRPVWYGFDPVWYLAAYPFVAEQMIFLGCADVLSYFRDFGIGLGHSPNRFFDEAWYRARYPDIAEAIANDIVPNGFVHYLTTGFHERSPHWLFDESCYLEHDPSLSHATLAARGFRNGYDHYLAEGDRAGQSGHWLFDPPFVAEGGFDGVRAGADGPFHHVMGRLPRVPPTITVSTCFDAIWYLKTYPEVGARIAAGEYSCALHHFLANPTPTSFRPGPWFSEQYYRIAHADVDDALERGMFRSGYEHFLKYGVAEYRRPNEDVDLRAYLASGCVRDDLESGRYPDIFRHWLAACPHDRSATPPMRLDEDQTKAAFRQTARDAMLLHAREPIDFTPRGAPDVSVIVVVRNHFALTLQALASVRAGWPGDIDLIVVDSGSHDETIHIERFVTGARLIRFSRNLGYVDACNAALRHVAAPATLFLNNDLTLGHQAIGRAMRRLTSAPDIGAVGAKLVRTNGVLQEAGSIIWRDGSTGGYLRDRDPTVPEANFVRDVDYCSGAFLMVRSDILRAMDGFDPAFSPAYYEEVDLCVRLRKAGYRTVYDPAIVVRHLEYGSSDGAFSHGLMRRNLHVFATKHRDVLRYCYPRNDENAVFARTARQDRRRILYIEDRIPLRHLGSGYVRSNDIVRMMVELGYHVTIFPITPSHESLPAIYRDFPDSVEILHDRDIDVLADFVRGRSRYYDLTWVGRTHNLDRLLPALAATSVDLPVNGFILDTECIAAPRTAARARVLGLPPPPPLPEALRAELACAYFCQQIVTVNAHDAELARQAGFENISILGHMIAPRPTMRRWVERQDMLFLGAIHDMGSPNYDSLDWFVTHVLPLLPPTFHLSVAGHVGPTVHFTAFAGNGRVRLLGPVDDPAPLYDQHRVFVAPTRFAGGMPYKIHEAASYGLPVVATELLCTQTGWTDGRDILSGGTDDPRRFAEAIMALHDDPALWTVVRNGALRRLAQENGPDSYRNELAAILNGVLAHVR
ncbi:glycosyltransferase [Gluconacetobacter johannae]|uniref:Glycosyltransferase n=1 Tax=Gluconacetobacter johannae TaxID=112140 RepID=A0A7W4J425_9PROT|nr:glycosyltransferase [Gluconacetobacter johannae]MBB2174333.1 glycosyltransferase [Gluconacetobacter johannae]